MDKFIGSASAHEMIKKLTPWRGFGPGRIQIFVTKDKNLSSKHILKSEMSHGGMGVRNVPKKLSRIIWMAPYATRQLLWVWDSCLWYNPINTLNFNDIKGKVKCESYFRRVPWFYILLATHTTSSKKYVLSLYVKLHIHRTDY